MSRDNRFDRLESDIVDALRRAPGASPSADLDARILARAHAAVAAPKRRPQPIWLSMAAGLTLLVGSGLALRIWQQVEHAPSALDMPAAKVSAPAKSAADADSAAGPAVSSTAASGEDSVHQRQQEAPVLEEKRSELARSAPMAASRAPEQQALELRHENLAGAAAKLESASGLAASPELPDQILDAAPKPAAPRPFPAEPAPIVATAPAATMAIEQAPAREAPAELPAAPPAEIAAAPVAAPAPAAAVASADDLGVIDLAKPLSQPGADASSAAGIAVTGALAGGSEGLAKRDRAEEADQAAAATGEDGPGDVYANRLAAVRKAIAAGDQTQARRLLAELRRQFPQRELPKDLRIWAEQHQ